MPLGAYILLILAGTAVLAACLWAFSRIPLQQERGNIDEIPVEGTLPADSETA